MKYIIAAIITLAAPILLLPIEQLFPYSYILEEVFKAGIIVYLLSGKIREYHLHHFVILGILFTFSETVLYLFNFFLLGNFSALGLRLVVTGALHSLTFSLLWLFGQKSRQSLAVGLLVTLSLHVLFNEWLVGQVLGF